MTLFCIKLPAFSFGNHFSPYFFQIKFAKAETVKVSTCSGFCCIPSLERGIMVSDPSSNIPQNREGGGSSITRKRRVSYDDNASNMNGASANGDDKRDREAERDKDRQSQFYSKYSCSSSGNNNGDNPDNLDDIEKNQAESESSLHRRYNSNLSLLRIVTDSLSASSSSLEKRMIMGMGIGMKKRNVQDGVDIQSKSSNDCHSQNDNIDSNKCRSRSQSDLNNCNNNNCQESNLKSGTLEGKIAVISDDEGEGERGSEEMGIGSSRGQISPFKIEKRNMKQILSDVSDFPFFPRGATSLLSRYLTREIYNEYEDRRTSTSNCSLPELIRPGTENPKLRIGVVAGDEECYQTFSGLFDPIISGLHNFIPGSTSQLRDAQPMKLDGILGNSKITLSMLYFSSI